MFAAKRGNTNVEPPASAGRGPCRARPKRAAKRRSTDRRLLVELHLLDGDDVLVAFLADGASHGAVLGGGADRLVVFLAGLGVEVIGDVLLIFLDNDHGGALGLDAEVALGARDLALESDFLALVAGLH